MDLFITIDFKKHAFRERLILSFLNDVIPLHSKIYRHRKEWHLKTEDLMELPQGSLGKEMGIFLNKACLQPIPKIERHDAFHILLGFSTQVKEEVAMQVFLLGNGKISPFTIVASVFPALLLPEYWQYFMHHYNRGKEARSIAKWDFRELLEDNFEDIRKLVFRHPIQNEHLMDKVAAFENTK